MENTFLYKVFTRREVDADCNQKHNSILLTIEELPKFDQEPASWGLKGQNFLEALIGLVEQLALAPDGHPHKFLGDRYFIELSGSDRAPYISIEAEIAEIAEIAGKEVESFTRTFEYEPEATLDYVVMGNTVEACRKVPISRPGILTSCHLEMIAGILVIAREGGSDVLIH